MDQQSQARWNDWAKALSREVFNAMFSERAKGLAETTADVLIPQLRKRDAHIAELEGRIARLERAISGKKAIEWPLREKSESERAAA